MQEIRPRLFFDFVFSSFCFFHPRCKQNFVVVFVSFFLELESIETRKFKIVKIRGIYPRCNEISSSFSCRFFLSQNRQITARKSETKMYPIGRGAIGVTPLPPPPFLRQQMMGGGVPPPSSLDLLATGGVTYQSQRGNIFNIHYFVLTHGDAESAQGLRKAVI